MRIRPRFILGAALIVGAIGYLIFTSIRSTSEYYLTVPEVGARQGELSGQALRIAGRVRTGSIAWEPSTLTLKFAIYPIPDSPPGAPAGVQPVGSVAAPIFNVVSVGEPKPDMFADERDVIVEGTLGRDGTIAARQVMTSCPSKYRPADAK